MSLTQPQRKTKDIIIIKLNKKIEKLTYDVELKSLLRAGHLNTRRRPKPELGRAQTIATYGPAQIDDRKRAK